MREYVVFITIIFEERRQSLIFREWRTKYFNDILVNNDL